MYIEMDHFAAILPITLARFYNMLFFNFHMYVYIKVTMITWIVGVMRSKVKGHQVILYTKVASPCNTSWMANKLQTSVEMYIDISDLA